MTKTLKKSYTTLLCFLFFTSCGEKSKSSAPNPNEAVLSEISALSFMSLPQDLPDFKELAQYKVNAVYYDESSGVLYAGTAAGLSISKDRGMTWLTRTTRHGLSSNNITAIYADGPEIKVGTENGLSVSTDGGMSFAIADFAVQGQQVAVNALHFSSGRLYVATELGISVTADNGSKFAHFSTSNGLPGNVNRVYATQEKVFAATEKGFFVSENGGDNFFQKTISDGLQASVVHDIRVKDQNVYLGTDEGMAISNNGGSSFRMVTVADGLYNKHVVRIIESGNGLAALNVYSDGFQVRSILQSFNTDGTGFTEIYTSFSTLYIDAFASGSLLLLAGSTEGINISEDNGNQWKALTPRSLPSTGPYSAFAIQDGVIYLGTFDGLWASSDNGSSWKNLSLTPSTGKIYVNKIHVEGRSLYVGANTGFYASTDGGESWTHKTVSDGLPGTDVNDFIVTDSALYLVCGALLGSNQGLAVSVNNGNSFATTKLPAIAENKTLKAIHADDSRIYLASHGGLAVSSDQGTTWNDISPKSILGNWPITLVYSDNSLLYAASLDMLWISADQGASWARIRGPTSYESLATIQDITSVDGKILLSTEKGIEVSVDAGQSWLKLDSRNGLGSSSILMSIWDDAQLYALGARGVFRSVLETR